MREDIVFKKKILQKMGKSDNELHTKLANLKSDPQLQKKFFYLLQW